MNVILECKDCGSILVVNTKDLWHFTKCTHCDSHNIVNLDEEFDQVEVFDCETVNAGLIKEDK